MLRRPQPPGRGVSPPSALPARQAEAAFRPGAGRGAPGSGLPPTSRPACMTRREPEPPPDVNREPHRTRTGPPTGREPGTLSYVNRDHAREKPQKSPLPCANGLSGRRAGFHETREHGRGSRLSSKKRVGTMSDSFARQCHAEQQRPMKKTNRVCSANGLSGRIRPVQAFTSMT